MGRDKNSDSCIVKNCNSRAKNDINLHFHNFPKPRKRFIKRKNSFGNVEEIDQLIAWKMALKINIVTPRMRVCSLHFKKDDYILPDAPGKKILNKMAVPSLNLPYDKNASDNNKFQLQRPFIISLKIENLVQKVNNQEDNVIQEEIISTYEVKNEEESIVKEEPMEPCIIEDEVHLSNQAANDASILNPVERKIVQTSTASFSQDVSLKTSAALFSQDASVQTSAASFSQDVSVQTSTAPLLQEVSVQASVPFKYVSLIKNNNELSSVTGIENFDILNCIVDIVNNMNGNKYENLKMNTKDRIVMTYMKLKHNLCYSFLAVTFNCYSVKHCQRVFYDTVKVLSDCLKVDIPWPIKKKFKQIYPSVLKALKKM